MKLKSILFSTLLAACFTVPSSVFSQLTCIDSALSFNGNGQYLKIAPNDFSTGNFLKNLTGSYTIECLIKWNGGSDFQRIFDFHNGTQYFMALTTSENGNHVPRFAITTTGLTAYEVLDANMVLTPNVYHHIAVTWSAADSIATMYIDGQNVNSKQITIPADSIYSAGGSDSSGNYIGLSAFNTDPTLNGDIDEFRVSDTLRYDGNFSPAVPFVQDSHTLVLYHFNEGSGQQAGDSSGMGNTGELGSTADADANDPTWVTCNNVLATSFTTLTANNINNQVHINWTAPGNANSSYFEIERSNDAVHFAPIAKLNVKSSANSYSYVDVSPVKGFNFYRVKEADVNNSFTYSNVVRVNITNANSFTIYPTIANQTLHVSVSKTPSTIVIFNSNGKPVKTSVINSTEQDVDVSTLPSGSYFVKNITGNSSLKFVKQ